MLPFESEFLKKIIFSSEETLEENIKNNTLLTYDYVLMILSLGYYPEEYTKVCLELDQNFYEIKSKYKRLANITIGEEKYKVPPRLGRIDIDELVIYMKKDGFNNISLFAKDRYVFFLNNSKIKEIIENKANYKKHKKKVKTNTL